MPPRARLTAASQPPALPGRPRRAADRLARLGLRRDADLVLHLPMRYEDETARQTIGEAIARAGSGQAVQIEGVVTRNQVVCRPRRQLVVHLADASGELALRFLNFYASQIKQLAEGVRLRVRGEVRVGFFGAEMVHPAARAVTPDTPLPDRLTPVYPSTAGVPQAWLRRMIFDALARTPLPETLPDSLLQSVLAPLALMPLAQAVRLLHQPMPEADAPGLAERTHPAWQRVKFDELLAQQLSLKRAQAARRKRGAPVLRPRGPDGLPERCLAALPFRLTDAQARAWGEIRADLARAYPMQRLLQGDVGCGKTVIAALAVCQAIDAGWQAALMAPTELLAEQLGCKLSAWLGPLGVDRVWLAGSLSRRQKNEAAARVASGGASLVIGTHALIQNTLAFARLGLVVVDEQHRFGVAQRLALASKAAREQTPHQLMMSATPIPRTLAMTYCADLDVTAIDALPPGRMPVVTRLVNDARRDEVIARVHAAAREGRQIYWVCPLIEESEALQLQTAAETFGMLSARLAGIKVGLVHGRLSAADKTAVMSDFASGRLHVLVATTVIEVGVDVPNASLMVIEHAERFGLAQLHQLRGRVGRGAAESACLLLYQAPLSPTAAQRLQSLREIADGFEIAQRDLELRGPGEFLGARQSGEAMLRFADLNRDARLVEFARRAAGPMLAHFPEAVDAHLARWLGEREQYLRG